jgi:hypothetical protein
VQENVSGSLESSKEGLHMSDQNAGRQPYMVSIYEPEGAPGTLVFTFVPNGLQQVRRPNGAPQRVPQYIVLALQENGHVSLDWNGSSDDPGANRPEMEQEVEKRIQVRRAWVGLISELVSRVETWARELGWSTRRIEKTLDDSYIGRHRVAALLMQEELCRISLEPAGREAPGADGVVDLYLMPAYDDIASLYYYGGGWHLHYLAPEAALVASARQAAPLPVSKESLATVLEAMKRHAVQQ